MSVFRWNEKSVDKATEYLSKFVFNDFFLQTIFNNFLILKAFIIIILYALTTEKRI